VKRWHLPAGALTIALAGALALAYFNPESRPEPASPPAIAAPAPTSISSSAQALADAQCATCHAAIVEKYRQHGMSRSVGAAGEVPTGSVTNPLTKARYDIASNDGAFWLTGTTAEGGRRRQRVVGRIGAGIFDTSWATTEVDAATGVPTGRLFFAPVETLTESGLQLAPFEGHERSPGLDMPLTVDCLTCHTLDRPGGGATPFPAHQLGADAFASLRPLSCSACHGNVDRHAEIMSGRAKTSGEGLGLARLGRLDAAVQRDICARCHLQGDARIDLAAGAPDRSRPLAAQIPVLVPRRTQTDFRFVSQSERLVLSACFNGSPAMTCTTCHDPHSGARAQGVQSFERACISCHQQLPSHTAANATAGCISCHMRKSQPFDLPHVRTADHFIRRRIEPPQDNLPHRQFAEREGELMLFDAARLEPQLKTAAGRRWLGGVMAMGLLTMGRFEEAARHLEAFPAPGSPAARTASAPPGFAPLETSAAFHTVRGFVLMSRGKIDAATAAFSDAIAIDPNAADARLARARLRLDAGDIRSAGLDTEAVIRTYPQAEQPWDLRIEIAQRTGRPDLALSAADASTRLWPSNPRTWAIVAALAGPRGEPERARQALERARQLDPAVARGR
jgi:predicted CXXCH cytochrome family protein